MFPKTEKISESPSIGPAEAIVNRYSLDDLWRMADEEGTPNEVVSFEAMNAAKVRNQP